MIYCEGPRDRKGQTDRQTETERETDRQTESDREGDRQTDRQRVTLTRDLLRRTER